MATLTINNPPTILYYDSIRASTRNTANSGRLTAKTTHPIYRSLTVNGVLTHAIYNTSGAYIIGWVRDDDIQVQAPPVGGGGEPIPEPEPPTPDMTIEFKGETYELFKGTNEDVLLLDVGVNELVVKGNGIIRFHGQEELMA